MKLPWYLKYKGPANYAGREYAEYEIHWLYIIWKRIKSKFKKSGYGTEIK